MILRPQGDLLRLVDSYTGQMLATSHESIRRAELAEQKVQLEEERTHIETQRANSAEAKIIELQQELEKLRRKKN